MPNSAMLRINGVAEPEHDGYSHLAGPEPLPESDRPAFSAELRRLNRPPILSEIRSGAHLDSETFEPLTYHLPGIIPEGSTLLVGAPKIGKSWFVLALALAVAEGGRALGLEVESRPVLYFALEDGDRRLQDRCRTLLNGDPIPSDFEYLTWLEPDQIAPTVEAWIAEYPGDAPLMILDTLGKVMPPSLQGESAYQRDYRIGGMLKALAAQSPGTCILTNHHDRKAGSDDFVDRVSGTNGLAGSADTIVLLARGRGESEGTISVTGRDVIEQNYAVTFDGRSGLWSLAGNDLREAADAARVLQATQSLTELPRRIVGYVNEHSEGVSPSQIAEALGVESSHVRVWVRRLLESERIDQPERGLYKPVTSVTPLLSNEATDVTTLPEPY